MFGYIYRVKIKGKGNLGIVVESIYTKPYNLCLRKSSIEKGKEDKDLATHNKDEERVYSSGDPSHKREESQHSREEGEDDLLSNVSDEGTVDLEHFGVQVKEIKAFPKTKSEIDAEQISTSTKGDIGLKSIRPTFSMILAPGDILLSLNEISLLGFTSSECVALLKASNNCEERILHIFRDSNDTFDDKFMKEIKKRKESQNAKNEVDETEVEAEEGEDMATKGTEKWQLIEKEKRTSQFVQLLQGVPQELLITIPFSTDVSLYNSQYRLFTQDVKNVTYRYILKHLFSPSSRIEMKEQQKGKGEMKEKIDLDHSQSSIISDSIPPPPPLASLSSSYDKSSYTKLDKEEKDIGCLEVMISTIPGILVGDIVLEINGLHLKDMSYILAHKILKTALQNNGRIIALSGLKNMSSEKDVDEEYTPSSNLNLRILRIHHLHREGISRTYMPDFQSLTNTKYTSTSFIPEKDEMRRRWLWSSGIHELKSIKENLKGWSFVNSLCRWHKR